MLSLELKLGRILLYSLTLAVIVSGAPADTHATTDATVSSSAEPSTPTDPFASDDANPILWSPDSHTIPEAVRGPYGGSVLRPQNVAIDKENADMLAPPTTDHGDMPNAKWPIGLSHNRLQTGGWARQQNIQSMPIATQIAGVNMRLDAGAVRELHWHGTAEWGYIMKGSVQITSINQNGQNFLSTIGPGDVWYFPAGMPHSIQATNESVDGAEFILVFDDGSFSEDSTFLLTDWLSHVPKEVLAKNFQVPMSAFDRIPSEELYIYPAASSPDEKQLPVSAGGTIPDSYTYPFSKTSFTPLSGGSFKILDSSTFPASKTIAAAEVIVEPGAMRELHWHPTQDEWSFFLEGTGRMTIYAAQSNARTFDFKAGDIGYVPASNGHYIENTGNTTLRFLEVFRSDRYQDIGLQQWLALIPAQLVQEHLGLSAETLAHLNKTKQTVVGPV
ncbi:hypothetical protein SERLA73DRAFT_160828 [Serpula lacrymans var. lacrymans S7.3]|uniref:Cupin type-1 domain-containing protein n=2 Tax=Serpula lacrymans var. lacrymans TaxID=341189 RepID=F8PXF8_SERL3|nr:putative oxalate decarboxylase/oxidase [Serpula lacrymans var. lacrymans S7.9]EGN99484.1 hypothetical protein SERLA73DRAFT_160828 [Serpula lacrymans var. lacrymans S7.3]EGO25065.1 putative oxalate decarboxylase/oxidase [Serpula lacrymans var. lacrymans S7.9]